MFLLPTNNGVFISTNNGSSWSPINNGLTDKYIHALAISGINIFAGTDHGVFFTANDGASWTMVNTGLKNLYIRSLRISDMTLFAGTIDGGVWQRPLSDTITSV